MYSNLSESGQVQMNIYKWSPKQLIYFIFFLDIVHIYSSNVIFLKKGTVFAPKLK